MCYKRETDCTYATVVHGPLRRNLIGEDDLTIVVANLVRMFEVPLHVSGFT